MRLPSLTSWGYGDKMRLSKFKRRWLCQRKSHQTKIGGSNEPPIFFYFLANPREISRFVINIMGLFFPALMVEQAHFSPLTTCLTTCGDFCTISRYKKCKNCTFIFTRRCKFINELYTSI